MDRRIVFFSFTFFSSPIEGSEYFNLRITQLHALRNNATLSEKPAQIEIRTNRRSKNWYILVENSAISSRHRKLSTDIHSSHFRVPPFPQETCRRRSSDRRVVPGYHRGNALSRADARELATSRTHGSEEERASERTDGGKTSATIGVGVRVSLAVQLRAVTSDKGRKKVESSPGRDGPIKQPHGRGGTFRRGTRDICHREMAGARCRPRAGVKRLTVKLIESFKVIGIDNGEVSKSRRSRLERRVRRARRFAGCQGEGRSSSRQLFLTWSRSPRAVVQL